MAGAAALIVAALVVGVALGRDDGGDIAAVAAPGEGEIISLDASTGASPSRRQSLGHDARETQVHAERRPLRALDQKRHGRETTRSEQVDASSQASAQRSHDCACVRVDEPAHVHGFRTRGGHPSRDAGISLRPRIPRLAAENGQSEAARCGLEGGRLKRTVPGFAVIEDEHPRSPAIPCKQLGEHDPGRGWCAHREGGAPVTAACRGGGVGRGKDLSSADVDTIPGVFLESDLALALPAVAASALWLVAAGAVLISRTPPQPPVGPRTLELGPEPPAVANFVVNDFRVTDDAVPATLIDLAARNVIDIEQRGPGVFYVRLRASSSEPVTSYERRILAHLHTNAVDGVVPGGALTTGPQPESKRWMRGFTSEVVADAKERGLSRDAVDGSVFTVLTGAALIPALFAWATWEFQAGLLVIGGAVALLSWIRARHPQRETPAGMEVASRWLGVRAGLEEDDEFARQSPLTVELWDRLLAYGAALGVAGGSSRPLPMGVESDTNAWTAHGGRWRSVRISYPRFWPPGWGTDPLVALAVGLAVVVGSTFFLYVSGPSLIDAGVFGAVPLSVIGIAVILGVAVVVVAASDWRTAVEVTGPILRLRSFGDDKKPRYYVAVDDGDSREIRAFKVSPRLYQGLEQGDEVTVRATSNLGCVRWIIPASNAD